MATLAIDFDGVIHQADKPIDGKSWGPPVEGAKAALSLLRNEQNHKIIIFSCKPPDVIEQWMRDYDIPFDSITNKKPEADCYLDDKSVRFISWEQALPTMKFWGILD